MPRSRSISSWAEAARLTELGCDRAHGWLFASAQPADVARRLLARGAGWRTEVVSPATRADPWSTSRTSGS